MLTPNEMHDAHAEFTRWLNEIDVRITKAEGFLAHLRDLREHIMTFRSGMDAAPPQFTTSRVDMGALTKEEIDEITAQARTLAPKTK